MCLCHEIGREERVLKSVPPKHDFAATSQPVNSIENPVPAILRHQSDQSIQGEDVLLIDLFENFHAKCIGGMNGWIGRNNQDIGCR